MKIAYAMSSERIYIQEYLLYDSFYTEFQLIKQNYSMIIGTTVTLGGVNDWMGSWKSSRVLVLVISLSMLMAKMVNFGKIHQVIHLTPVYFTVYM